MSTRWRKKKQKRNYIACLQASPYKIFTLVRYPCSCSQMVSLHGWLATGESWSCSVEQLERWSWSTAESALSFSIYFDKNGDRSYSGGQVQCGLYWSREDGGEYSQRRRPIWRLTPFSDSHGSLQSCSPCRLRVYRRQCSLPQSRRTFFLSFLSKQDYFLIYAFSCLTNGLR